MLQANLKSQQGTVLVTVMMMVAVAALIVTDISYRQKLDILRTSALLSRDQAFQYLMGAEELAKLALYEDLKADNSRNNPVFKDSLAEIWAKETPPYPVPGGFIKGRLIDLQGRFNVNSLIAEDSKLAKEQRQRLVNLMRSQGIPTDTSLTANQLVERIVDWLDADQTPTGFDGKEDLDYLKYERPFRAANQVVFDISELAVIPGIETKELEKIADFISFLPPEAALNLNTADQAVLTAFHPQFAQIVGKNGRDEPCDDDKEPGYCTVDDAFARISFSNQNGNAGNASNPGNNTGNKNNRPVGNFDVKSEYYMLEAEAVVNGKSMLMRSVLFRPKLNTGQQNKDIRIKTLLRKLEDPLKRV